MSTAQLLEKTSDAAWLGAIVLRAQPSDVEVLLPYRDEFSNLNHQPAILSGVIAALADLTGLLSVTSVHNRPAALRSLRVDYLGAAPAGQQLHAQGRLAGDTVQIAIHTSDDRALVARATAAFAVQLDIEATHAPRQPIYPN